MTELEELKLLLEIEEITPPFIPILPEIISYNSEFQILEGHELEEIVYITFVNKKLETYFKKVAKSLVIRNVYFERLGMVELGESSLRKFFV